MDHQGSPGTTYMLTCLKKEEKLKINKLGFQFKSEKVQWERSKENKREIINIKA